MYLRIPSYLSEPHTLVRTSRPYLSIREATVPPPASVQPCNSADSITREMEHKQNRLTNRTRRNYAYRLYVRNVLHLSAKVIPNYVKSARVLAEIITYAIVLRTVLNEHGKKEAEKRNAARGSEIRARACARTREATIIREVHFEFFLTLPFNIFCGPRLNETCRVR